MIDGVTEPTSGMRREGDIKVLTSQLSEPISGTQREELEETEGHRSRVMGDYQPEFETSFTH